MTWMYLNGLIDSNCTAKDIQNCNNTKWHIRGDSDGFGFRTDWFDTTMIYLISKQYHVMILKFGKK